MNALPAEADVVIVGADPRASPLPACSRRSASVSAPDRQVEGANTSRAAVIHAHTLEVLEALSVTARLHAEGHVVPRFVLRDRDRVLGSVSFRRSSDTLSVHPYAPEHPAIFDIERLLDTRGPVTTPAHVGEVVWSSRFQVHHRIADR